MDSGVSKTVVVVGHSHLVALREATETQELPFAIRFLQLGPGYNPLVRPEGGKLVYNERADAEFVALMEETAAPMAFGSILGAESAIWTFEGQSRPFDVVLPFRPDLPAIEGAETVPYGLLRHSLYDHIVSSLRVLGHLQALTGTPMVQLLPPPPTADRDALLEDGPLEFRDIIRKHGVPSLIIQYKLWVMWNDIATEVAAADGIRVVPHPTDTVDATGLLRRDFSSDFVHGNARYGAIVLRQLYSLLAAET